MHTMQYFQTTLCTTLRMPSPRSVGAAGGASSLYQPAWQRQCLAANMKVSPMLLHYTPEQCTPKTFADNVYHPPICYIICTSLGVHVNSDGVADSTQLSVCLTVLVNIRYPVNSGSGQIVKSLSGTSITQTVVYSCSSSSLCQTFGDTVRTDCDLFLHFSKIP